MKIKESTEWRTLQLEGPQVKVRYFLKPDKGVSESFKALPCFMQSSPRKAPPFRPAGLDTCEQEDLVRWKAGAYRFPPYQYKKQNLVQRLKTKKWHPPGVEVREELLGFRRDHAFECMPMKERKKKPRAHEDARLSLLGSSIHVPVLAMVLAPQLKEWGFLGEIPSMNELAARASRAWAPRQAEERMLVLAYVNRQTHRGGEIKLEDGSQRMTERPRAQPIDAGQWQWTHVICCAWSCQAEHISALEARG